MRQGRRNTHEGKARVPREGRRTSREREESRREKKLVDVIEEWREVAVDAGRKQRGLWMA